MNVGIYLDTGSPLHRLNAGIKLASVFLFGSGIVFISNLWVLAAVLIAVAFAYGLARIPLKTAIAQVRGAFYILAIIFLFQTFAEHWITGAIVVARFLAILSFAALVTLTTRVSDMVEVLEKAMQPFRVLGVNPSKVSLAISLSIRFIPVVAQIFREVREAQKARGLGRSVSATAIPLIVRTLRMANEIAEALEARSYDGEPPKRTEAHGVPEKQTTPVRGLVYQSNSRDVK